MKILVEHLSYRDTIIQAFWKKEIDIDKSCKALTWIIKVLEFSSKNTLANLWFSMSCTPLVIDKVSWVIYNLQISFLASNYKSAILRERNNISKSHSY